MPMERDTDNTASEDEAARSASLQRIIDMLEHNIHEHVKRSEGLIKKLLVQEFSNKSW